MGGLGSFRRVKVRYVESFIVIFHVWSQLWSVFRYPWRQDEARRTSLWQVRMTVSSANVSIVTFYACGRSDVNRSYSIGVRVYACILRCQVNLRRLYTELDHCTKGAETRSFRWNTQSCQTVFDCLFDEYQEHKGMLSIEFYLSICSAVSPMLVSRRTAN